MLPCCRLADLLQVPRHAQLPAAAAAGAQSSVTNNSSGQRQSNHAAQALTLLLENETFCTPGSGSSLLHTSRFSPTQPTPSPTATIAEAVACSVITAAAHLLSTAGSAAAAKIEVDVPDFLVDHNPVDAVLHSPVLAIGAAVLALLLFPKLIRVSNASDHHLPSLPLKSQLRMLVHAC
jgi:hypothetical protein